MNALPELVIVPAGAGSGKTYWIKEQLADWVVSGAVGPDRIAAVTFTETAAGELQNRIRAELMARGRLEDALRLDQSFITTIHGFGNRLLVEYAFEAGCSPAFRLLEEDEERLLLRKSIARIARIESISRKLELFGYRYDFASGTDSAGQFRNRILACVHILRAIGGDLNRTERLQQALGFIERAYGPTEDADMLTESLRRSVRHLLQAFPDCMRDYVNSESAKEAVESDYRVLQEAVSTPDLAENWLIWKRLQNLKVFKNDNQLPSAYQEAARGVMALAGRLCVHPGPLADAKTHTRVILESAWDALADYAERKRDNGIVDYTDMIDLSRQLLETPAVIEHASRRFDCLIIDEFQDTNPLQFSMLWQLHRKGIPAFVVGDVKQSIMGFQSADPRLMNSLIHQYREQCRPLRSNWRSQPLLMEVVNAIGSEMFEDTYTHLAPRAAFKSRLPALEVISFKGRAITQQIQAQHVAARIKGILSDKRAEVYDSRLQRHRRVRGGDIAVLGLTHERLKGYAGVLAEIGVRSQLERDGWFLSRPVQLLYYGLCFAADTNDRHAAMYLAVTELGEEDLSTAAAVMLDKEMPSLPLLDRLEAVAQHNDTLTVDELVAATLEAMELYDRVSLWPDAAQARASLLRFQDRAAEFMQVDQEALAGGGFYGTGLKTFLAWLRRNLAEKEGDRQPTPYVHDEDAVRLITWHAAKGMEWPIVVVTTLDRDVKGQLPYLGIEFTRFEDLKEVLSRARIKFFPGFADPQTNRRFQSALDDKVREEGLNLLYVALTRAREQLILEWPQNLAASKRYTFWHLLQDSARMHLEGNRMLIGGASFDCRTTAADREPPPEFRNPVPPSPQALPVIGRRALQVSAPPAQLSPAFLTPSRLYGQASPRKPPAITPIQYGKPIALALHSGAERGLMIHRIFELLCQGVSADAVRAAVGHTIQEKDWQVLQSTAGRFVNTLSSRFHPTSLLWEVPVLAADKAGCVINGTIDLLLKTPAGYWILDHKTDETENREERFNHYRPQLDCYARAVGEGLGLQVAGLALHWVCYCEIGCLVAEKY